MTAWRNEGLRLSDYGLYLRGVVSDAQKIVLAAQQSPRSMDETVEQLAARLPMAPDQIKDARAALQAKGILTMTPPKNLTPGQRAQVGFRRGRTITAVDERFSKVGVYSVFVPGHAVESLMSVKTRGMTAPLLLLMVYTRIQARKGVAFAYEAALRRDLDFSPKVVKRAVGILRESGLIEQAGTHNATPIFNVSWMRFDLDGATLETVRRDTTQHERPEKEVFPLAPSCMPSRPLVPSLSPPLSRPEDLQTARLSLTSFEKDDRSAISESGTDDEELIVYPREAPF